MRWVSILFLPCFVVLAISCDYKKGANDSVGLFPIGQNGKGGY